MDAYTLRKIAPRILLGVIGINLSIYLCVAAIDVTNIIGRGLADLMTAPFDMKDVGLDTGASSLTGIIGILVAMIGGAYAIIGLGSGLLGIGVLFILTIMITVLAIMATLVIRQILLIILTILSPVAVACYILPGTEKYFRQWWDIFVKALMVYPIIAALFAISGIMATISFSTAGTPETNNLQGAFNIFTGLVLVYIPLFLIPWSFKFAGGVLASVSNIGSGQLQRLSRGRQLLAERSRNKNWQDIKEGNRFSGGRAGINGKKGNIRGRLNRRLQGAALVGSGALGANPANWKSNLQSERSRATLGSAMKAIQENSAMKAVAVNDDLASAALHGNMTDEDARSYLVAHGQEGQELEQNLATIRTARQSVGDSNFQVASAVALAGTKTGYADGAGQMMSTINRVAGDDIELARSMTFAAREQASNAQRFDLSEAGAGTYLNGLSYLRQNGDSLAAQEQITRNVTDDIVENKSAQYLMSGHSNSFKNLAPALQRRIAKASNLPNRANEIIGDKVKENAIDSTIHVPTQSEAHDMARREFVQTVAASEAMLDAASASSPAAAKVMADSFQSTQVHLSEMSAEDRTWLSAYQTSDGKIAHSPSDSMSVRQLIDHLGGRAEYREMRRTYGNAYQADMAQSAQTQQQANQPPGGPTVEL